MYLLSDDSSNFSVRRTDAEEAETASILIDRYCYTKYMFLDVLKII